MEVVRVSPEGEGGGAVLVWEVGRRKFVRMLGRSCRGLRAPRVICAGAACGHQKKIKYGQLLQQVRTTNPAFQG